MATLNGAILYDVTEFVRHPLRTGIQRVVFEILRHWPKEAPRLAPVVLAEDGAGFQLLPEGFSGAMTAHFETGADLEAGREVMARLRRRAEAVPAQALNAARAVFNPEVFYDPVRARFYRDLAAGGTIDIHFVVYDALPWLRPDLFTRDNSGANMAYLHALRAVPYLHFISAMSRDDYARRVLRRGEAGMFVHPLGADGLGRAAPPFDPGNRTFASIGTIEPRKRHHILLQACEGLWEEGHAFELVLAGRAGWQTDDLQARMADLADKHRGFRWLADASDARVREIVTGARATLFCSDAEGYGLPPVESLALGVPVMVSERIPATAGLPALGQVRLQVVDLDSVRAALLRLLDDGEAARLRAEITQLDLPTWKGHAASLAATLGGTKAARAALA